MLQIFYKDGHPYLDPISILVWVFLDSLQLSRSQLTTFTITLIITLESLSFRAPSATNCKAKAQSHVADDLLLDQKEYSLRWNFEGKGVLLFDQKEYSFWSIFEAKGVLLLVHFWSKRSASLKKKKSASTPLSWKIGKREYSFWSKNGPKGVLLYPDFSG